MILTVYEAHHDEAHHGAALPWAPPGEGDMRGADLPRFIALAKQGQFRASIATHLRYQEKDQMERGVDYSPKVLESR
jgi:hypothetical protein